MIRTDDALVEALLAVAAGDHDGAVRQASAAAAAAAAAAAGSPTDVPRARLAGALVRHLSGGGGDVYSDPAAFERFIDGGGNVELYRRAHAALADRHRHARPARAVDFGCGDGRLTTAALGPGLGRLDLVEPSAELLAAAEARLAAATARPAGLAVVGHPVTAQRLLEELPGDAGWDVAQSTFALHTVPPADRSEVLADLARQVGRLLVVEFDVPPFADRSAAHARRAVERYAAGVAEYADDDLVVDGFLVPVLVGQFAPDRPRHTWEQPIAAWVADLVSAGFTEVRTDLVTPYWWAPAHLLDARGRRAPS